MGDVITPLKRWTGLLGIPSALFLAFWNPSEGCTILVQLGHVASPTAAQLGGTQQAPRFTTPKGTTKLDRFHGLARCPTNVGIPYEEH